MTEQDTLTCPKCGADMRSYERNGVTVDQCTACRGIFLDRGELERLVAAEGAFYAGSATPVPPVPAPQVPPGVPYGRGGHHGSPGGYPGQGGYDKHGRRRGFLGGLFD